MKLSVPIFLIAALMPTARSPFPFVVPSVIAQTASVDLSRFHEQTATTNKNATYDYFVGSNARWIIDRLHGAVLAWDREKNTPLWSQDGVVYRTQPLINHVSEEVVFPAETLASQAPEIFGRVYFFLDARRTPKEAQPCFRRDNLLIALDVKAQGRLVWQVDVQDFASFFPPNERRALRFLNEIRAASNDALLIQIQSEQEIKPFLLDAATGRLVR